MVRGIVMTPPTPPAHRPPRNGGTRLYFSPFLPLSDPRNAKHLVGKRLFYQAATKFDVFGFFNNFIALKPAIIHRSADLAAERLGKLPAVRVKEMAAGTGDALGKFLEYLRDRHPGVYRKTTAVASDGYPGVVDLMRRSPTLQLFQAGGKLALAVEDIGLPAASTQPSDYVRLSCVLCELPEDTVRVVNGRYQIAYVRGYIEGSEPFAASTGKKVKAEVVQRALQSGNLQRLIALGLLPPNLSPRIQYETQWRPAAFGEDAAVVRQALDKITRGIKRAEFKLGLSSAKTAENILRSHLSDRTGSYVELFDSWTAEMVEDMPCAELDYGLTSVIHPNYPFLAAYLAAKGYPVETKFENWYEYTGAKEPYIYLHTFHKWLKQASRDQFTRFFGRDIWGNRFEERKSALLKHLNETQLKYEEVLQSETDHPFVVKLTREYDFSAAEIDRLFTSGIFTEPVRSKIDGFYGNYQVVTVTKL